MPDRATRTMEKSACSGVQHDTSRAEAAVHARCTRRSPSLRGKRVNRGAGHGRRGGYPLPYSQLTPKSECSENKSGCSGPAPVAASGVDGVATGHAGGVRSTPEHSGRRTCRETWCQGGPALAKFGGFRVEPEIIIMPKYRLKSKLAPWRGSEYRGARRALSRYPQRPGSLHAAEMSANRAQ